MLLLNLWQIFLRHARLLVVVSRLLRQLVNVGFLLWNWHASHMLLSLRTLIDHSQNSRGFFRFIDHISIFILIFFFFLFFLPFASFLLDILCDESIFTVFLRISKLLEPIGLILRFIDCCWLGGLSDGRHDRLEVGGLAELCSHALNLIFSWRTGLLLLLRCWAQLSIINSVLFDLIEWHVLEHVQDSIQSCDIKTVHCIKLSFIRHQKHLLDSLVVLCTDPTLQLVLTILQKIKLLELGSVEFLSQSFIEIIV